MILRTLYAKLSLGLMVLLVIVGLVYGGLSTVLTQRYQEDLSLALNKHLARNIVADRNLVAEGRLNDAALKETFGLYMNINPSIEIYLLDLEGRILSFSADKDKIKRKSVSLGPIRDFLAQDMAVPMIGDDPRSHDRQKAFSVTPVPSASYPQGYLYVVLRGEQYVAAERMARDSHFLRLGTWAMAASLGIGLIAGLIVFHLLTRRLHRLADLMGGFAQSGFKAEVAYAPAGGADEVDRLGVTFEAMAARIRAQIDQLQEQDALRRRLVAQVSHDLRTPLSSLRGYLESLRIKDETLSTAEKAEFLRIAIDQSERLGRQIDELFELASLEAREREADAEPFPIAELLHDIVQKHQPEADKRAVTLTLTAPPDLPPAVGDIGLTERVFDNLIANAIAYIPANGGIAIAADADGPWLRVVVGDTGPGIAAADLETIFDPFERGGNTTAGRHHAGLGLAIAKRIMDLQNGRIHAESPAGGGARFVVRFPLQSA